MLASQAREGSSNGRGLGTKFLRHIERTGTLFHFISSESPDPEKDYITIRKELGAHEKKLLEKPEYLLLAKSDLAPPQELKKKLAALKKINQRAFAVSVHNPESLRKIEKILNEIKKEEVTVI